MNEKQKDNLAKFFYDIAKIIFASIVISPFVKLSEFRPLTLVLGLVATAIPLLIALELDKRDSTMNGLEIIYTIVIVGCLIAFYFIKKDEQIQKHKPSH